jgi:hypothetical protein
MEQPTQQPVKPTEEQRSPEFNINAFQQMLKTLQERKNQGYNFKN